MGTQWIRGSRIGVVATLGLFSACGGKYDVGSGDDGGAGGSEAGGSSSGGTAGDAPEGGSSGAGTAGSGAGGSGTGGSAIGGATGAGGSEAGGSSGASSGGFAGAAGGPIGGSGGSAGESCSPALPTLEPYEIASPEEVYRRLTILVYDQALEATELPEDASVEWARGVTLGLMAPVAADLITIPGMAAFMRDWAFGGDATNAARWGWAFFGPLSSLFVNQDAEPTSFLTEEAFLTTYPNSTKRGLWMANELFCEEPTLPPAGISIEPLEPAPGMTRRETIMQNVSGPACQGCHALYDPLGFSLEHYDELGAYRDTENGQPIDASGPYQGIEFSDIDELAPQLAGLCEVQRCVAQRVFEDALDRVYQGNPPAYDPAEVEFVQFQFRLHDESLPELILAIATTPAMLRE